MGFFAWLCNENNSWEKVTSEYKYQDKVKVVKGFYTGQVGVVIKCNIRETYEGPMFVGWRVMITDGNEIDLKSSEIERGE